MRCLIWRQHRGQALWVLLILAAMCTLMLVAGLAAAHWVASIRDARQSLKAAGCSVPQAGDQFRVLGPPVGKPGSCSALLRQLSLREASIGSYNFALFVFRECVPAAFAVIGALVGAPLVAREIEQRSQLAAWTQSVSRRRWYTTKVAALAAGLAVAGLAAGFANDWLQRPLTEGGLTSSHWPWFVSIDLALAGEAVLAFALAVAVGAWLRRTLPAIGGALIGSAVLLLGAWWAVRTLTPASRTTGPGFTVPPGGWIIQAQAGQGIPYHPASQYWPLQVTFLAILLALAAALLGAGWHATRTRAV
jgi:hypothetical protein